MSRMISSLRSRLTKLQVRYNDLKLKYEQDTGQLEKEIREQRRKRVEMQEHKLEQRSAMMGELERRDKKIVQLQRDLLNLTSNELEKLSLNTSMPQIRS